MHHPQQRSCSPLPTGQKKSARARGRGPAVAMSLLTLLAQIRPSCQQARGIASFLLPPFFCSPFLSCALSPCPHRVRAVYMPCPPMVSV